MNLHALDLPLGLELQTPRLRLCAPRESNGDSIGKGDGTGAEMCDAICASWPELREWMPWAKTLPTLADCDMNARNFLWKWNNRSELDFSIRLGSNGQVVGKCGLHTIEQSVGRAEIGYWLDSRFVGSGLMSEAVARLVSWGGELGFQRLEIRCDARNAPSKNVAKRLGFDLEGTLRRVRFDNRDQLCDLEIWARLL